MSIFTSPSDLPAKATKAAPRDHQFRNRRHARLSVARLVGMFGALSLIAMVATPARSFVEHLLAISDLISAGTDTITLGFIAVTSLLTARGLHRGHRLAWAAVLLATSGSAVLHVIRHGDPLDVTLLACACVWLVARQSAFTVRPNRSAVVRAALVAGGGASLAIGAGMSIDWTSNTRDLDGAAGSTALHLLNLVESPLGFGGTYVAPLLASAGLGLVALTLWTIWSPSKGACSLNRDRDRERAREIVNAHGSGTLDYFSLRNDKQWFFHGSSVVAYATHAGVCLVSPDPIGPADERREVWASFMQHAQSHGWTVSVLGADAAWLALYESFDLRPVYLGDEAIIDCSTFTLEGSKMKGLRQTCSRVRRHGFTATFHDPNQLNQDERGELLALAAISREGAVERGFSMTLSRLFDAQDSGLLMSVARDEQGRAQAFVQWVPAKGINGWSLDVMRRNTDPTMPNGLMDFLVTETVGHLRAHGETGLALNFAILREHLASEPTTTVGRWAKRGLELGAGRSQIGSLGRYNEKFMPAWRPRYVVLGDASATVNQALAMATAEGLTELPVIGRFMKGIGS